MWRVFRLNQKGISLVEALIGVAVLGGIAIVITQANDNFRPQRLGIKRVCQSHAQSILNTIQEETYYRSMVNFVPVGVGAGVRSAGNFSGGADAPTAAVTNPPLANLWFTGPAAAWEISPANPTATPDVDGVELQNFQLIQGTMRSLATIYNNVPAVRCALGAYAPLTAAGGAVAWPAELTRDAGTVLMRIQPYNRATGAAICPAALYPAPTGAGDGLINDNNVLTSAFAAVQPGAGAGVWTPTDAALPGGHEAFDPASVPANRSLPPTYRMATRGLGSPVNSDPASVSHGFEVTLQVSYTHDGVADVCEVSQKFEYPVDRSPPGIPTVQVVRNDSYPPAAARPTCGPNIGPTASILVNPVQIRIGVAAGEQERGVQLLCRDLSWQKVRLANPAPYNEPPCIQGGAIVPERPQYDDVSASQNFALRENYWVPCDRVTQCGYQPTAAYSLANPNNANDATLTLTYAPDANFISADGLRTCVFNMEVVAVDTAGNTHIAGNPANRVFLEQPGSPIAANQPVTNIPTPPGHGNTGVDRANEILPTACGQFCPRTSDWVGADFPNGYWTCRTGGTGPDVTPDRCCVDAPGSSACTWNN